MTSSTASPGKARRISSTAKPACSNRSHPQFRSVIDIGCASGRFVELLATLGATPRYTGLDLSEASVARARALYPAHDFHCVNALTFEPENTADLVNATGVMQHEPRFDALLDRMISWSRRHVLFDIKLAAMSDHLADIERAYIASDPPMYFVVLSADRFLREIAERRDIRRAEIFGYETPRNANAVLPPEIGPLVSAGVLLETGTPPAGGPEIISSLPPFLSNNSE